MSELKSWWNSLHKASYNLLDIPKKLPLHSSFIWFQPCVKEARRSKTSTFSPSIASSPWINCTLEFTFMFAPPGNNTPYITTLWFGHLTHKISYVNIGYLLPSVTHCHFCPGLHGAWYSGLWHSSAMRSNLLITPPDGTTGNTWLSSCKSGPWGHKS